MKEQSVSCIQAARILRVSVTRIQVLITTGALGDAKKVDGQWRIPLAAVTARRNAMQKLRSIQKKLARAMQASHVSEVAAQSI